MRLFASRLIIALLSTAVSIACMELYVRKTDPISIVHLNLHKEFRYTSDETIYEPVPNTTFNADGLRNEKNYTVYKPENIYRILLIGDSLAFGLGLSDKERLATLLENSLNASGSGIMQYEVLNLGVPGYSISQIISRLKKNGLKYKPDIIVYWHWLDDVSISDPGWASSRNNVILRFIAPILDTDEPKSTYTRIFGSALYNSQVFRHLLKALRERSEYSIISTHIPTYSGRFSNTVERLYKSYINQYTHNVFSDLSCCEKYYESFANMHNFIYWNYYLGEFSQICREQKTSCIVLQTPVLYPHKKGEYNWKALNGFITSVANEYTLRILDATPILNQYDQKTIKLHADDSEHLNATGNQCLSEFLRPYLQNYSE